jgi:hypothetical protein
MNRQGRSLDGCQPDGVRAGCFPFILCRSTSAFDGSFRGARPAETCAVVVLVEADWSRRREGGSRSICAPARSSPTLARTQCRMRDESIARNYLWGMLQGTRSMGTRTCALRRLAREGAHSRARARDTRGSARASASVGPPARLHSGRSLQPTPPGAPAPARAQPRFFSRMLPHLDFRRRSAKGVGVG